MTDRPDHATVERTFRALLETQGMPQPDEIAHWRDCVVFGWRDAFGSVSIRPQSGLLDDQRPTYPLSAWP